MAQVLITNLSGGTLSLDITIEEETIREKLTVGASVDVGDRLSIDDVNRSDDVKALIAAGTISVVDTAESDDLVADAPDKSLVPGDLDVMASAFLGAPVVADVDRSYATADWADGTLAILAQPDVPRNLTATLTDANDSVSGLLTLTGLDPAGRVVVETMAPDAAGGGKTLVGTKIFASITSQVISGTGGSVDAGSDQLVIGVGTLIGLPTDIKAAAAVKHTYLGGVLVTPDAVAAGVSLSGVDANGATYDGSKIMQVFYNLGD